MTNIRYGQHHHIGNLSMENDDKNDRNGNDDDLTTKSSYWYNFPNLK